MPLPAILLGMLVGGSKAMTQRREQEREYRKKRAEEDSKLNTALYTNLATDPKGRGQRALTALGIGSPDQLGENRASVMGLYGRLNSMPDLGDGKMYGQGDDSFVIQPYEYFEGNDRIKTAQYLGQFEQAASNGRLQKYLSSLSPSERAPFLSNISMFANSYWQEQSSIDPKTNTKVANSIPFDKQFRNLSRVLQDIYATDENVAGNGYRVPNNPNVKVNTDNGTFEREPNPEGRDAQEEDLQNQLNFVLPDFYTDKSTLTNLIEAHKLTGVNPNSDARVVSAAMSSKIMSRVSNAQGAIPIIKDLLNFTRVSDIMVNGVYQTMFESDKEFQAIYNKHVLQGDEGSAINFFQSLSALMPVSQYEMPSPRDVSPSGIQAGSYETIEKTWNKTATDVLGLKKIEEYGDRRDAARRYFATAKKIQTLLKQSGTSNLNRKLSQFGASAFNIAETFNLIQSHSGDESFDVSFLGETYKNTRDFIQNATLGSLIDFYTYELAYYRARAFEGNSARLSEQDFRRAKENVSGGMFEPKRVTDLKIAGIVKQAEFDNAFFNVLDETKTILGLPNTRQTQGQIIDGLRKLKTLGLVKTKLYADDPLYRAYTPTAKSLRANPELALSERLVQEFGLPRGTPVLQAVDGYGEPVFRESGGRFFVLDPRTENYIELEEDDFVRISQPTSGKEPSTLEPNDVPEGVPEGAPKDVPEGAPKDVPEGVPEGSEFLYRQGNLEFYKKPDGNIYVHKP
jgi:hypothetical protein